MSYIVQRNSRFYVVAYNGHDPITERGRRRWHPAGADPADAESMQRRIDGQRPKPSCETTLGGFMSTTWLETKVVLTRPTANRYWWMIDHHIAPRIGAIRLDALRPADLDACYGNLIANGGRRRQGLAPKSVLEIHRVICNAPDLAVDRQLIDTNPARQARPPKPRADQPSPRSGTPNSSANSYGQQAAYGSTRRSTSSHTTGCDAANSPV